MLRYNIARGALNALEKATSLGFRGLHKVVDKLERRASPAEKQGSEES